MFLGGNYKICISNKENTDLIESIRVHWNVVVGGEAEDKMRH